MHLVQRHEAAQKKPAMGKGPAAASAVSSGGANGNQQPVKVSRPADPEMPVQVEPNDPADLKAACARWADL